MKTIDKNVLAKYNSGIEKNRLKSGLGLIEFERTKELLIENLPNPPATIYDIGGAYGEYSFWLASLGYDVYLYDISKKNIEMAKEYSKNFPLKLKKMEVSDARSINLSSSSADAILLFGPLYHIVDKEERRLALKECYRLLKPNGLLFTAGITRFSTILWAITTYGVSNNLLDETPFREMIEKEIKTGQHILNSTSSYSGMGRSYFHHPNELKNEIEEIGFKDTLIKGIIGPCWLIPNLDEVWTDEVKRENIMKIVRLTEDEDSIKGLSTHLLSISKKVAN